MRLINYGDHDNLLMETSSGILDVFRENSVEQLRLDLWDWMKYVDEGKFMDKKDFTSIYKCVSILIDGAWNTLKKFNESGFKHYSCTEAFEPGPCLKVLTSENEERARSYRKRIVHYSGKILYLEQDELYDFYVVFERFFKFNTLVGWKSHLHEVSVYSKDKQPLCAKSSLFLYEYIAKLIESCFLLTRVLLQEVKRFPHFGFMERDWVAINMNTEDYDSPYENVNYALACYNATQFKKQLKRWYSCATDETLIWNDSEPGRLVLLYQFLQTFIDNAWIIYGCDEIMTRWVTVPYDNERSYNKPRLEKRKGVLNFTLSKEEIEDPHLVFSAFFGNPHMIYNKVLLQEWLCAALFSDTSESKDDELLSGLNKLIEAWYLINFRLCYPEKDPLDFTKEKLVKKTESNKS